MKLENLKKDIQLNDVSDELIIFKNPKNDFIMHQYSIEIAKQHNLNRVIIDDLSEINQSSSFFTSLVDQNLYVYIVDKFDCKDEGLLKYKNLIISCNTITKNTEAIYKDNIIIVPELTEANVKDYLYSKLDNIKTDDLNWLAKICANDIYRIDLEIDRLKLFSLEDRNFMLEQFKKDGIYSDLTQFNIFNLIYGINTRDINLITESYLELKNSLNENVFGIISLLHDNFKNIINIQLNKTPSIAFSGIKEKQYYAISKLPRCYSEEQLTNTFKVITSIDKKIKLGEIDTDLVLDYLLINIL